MPAENTVNYISNKNTEYRFLWVEFQLKAICEQVSDYGIEETLRNIPEDIHDTYERILDIINRKPPTQRELARKALLFVAYSRKPVPIDVLALAIAAKDHTQSLDIFRSSVSTEKTILLACGNLLSTDDDGHACFVHFSVQEYLISGRSKFVHAFSLEYEMAHREIARMCMIFLLILYSHIQDYSSGIEYYFIRVYILPALPFHLLDGNLNSLSSNDEMITLASLFFEKSPPMLGIGDSLCTFSSSVLALIFNLPGTYQCYSPRVLHREQLDPRVLVWIYERRLVEFNKFFDNRLAMHYAVGSLDSVAACQRLYNHRYPIEYFYSDSDTLNTTTHLGPPWIPDSCRVTPFYLVQSVEVARFLLDRGASVNPQRVNSELPSLLGYLVQRGNTEVMKLLWDHGAELEDKGLGEALVRLASGGKVEAIRMLLDHGVNISIQGADNYVDTPLQAAARGGYVRTIQLFLDEGADVNAQGGYYGNALQAAAFKGRIEAIQLLLDRGADVNAQGGEYGNALQAAASKGSIEAIQLLLDRGADVNAQGGKYGNALQAAAFGVSIEAIQLFLDKGADVNAQGGKYGNALQAAALQYSIESIQIFLDKGADVNAQGGEYGNALQIAAYNGNIIVMRLLLDKGADVNAQGGRYGNALQAALVPPDIVLRESKNPLHTAEILLDHGADITAYVAGSPHGDGLSAAKELWKHDKGSLAMFMKLLELKGWKEGKSGADENGSQV